MANSPQIAGKESQQKLGWLYSHRFLLLRRLTQFAVLGLFLLGPLFNIWILRGNYSSSLFLDTVPATDPLIMLQSLVTGYWPQLTVFVGAVIIAVVYAIFAGRLFCSWVCPFNLVSDFAAWLRRKLNIQAKVSVSTSLRYYVLAAVLIGSAVSGVLVWEWLNPITVLGRGMISAAWEYRSSQLIWHSLVVGFGAGIWLIVVIFLLDLFVFEHGWCGHVCPVGALYAVIGKKSLIHIDATRRADCTKCMDCIHVCPEPQVLPKPLFAKQDSTFILSNECIRCGRCIDVCPEKVFSIKIKFPQRGENDN